MFDFERLPTKFLAAAIVILGFGIYAASLTNDFVNLDDPLLIYENRAVQEISIDSIKTIFTTYDPELYVPLTLLTYQIEHFFFGLNPFFYHLTNLVLHMANALLVFWLVFLLSKDRFAGFVCALLFVAHPVNTEAVVWASARKDVLAAFFFLLSFVMFLLWNDNGKKSWYVLSIIAFLLALLSKVSVLVLPVLLLLTGWRDSGRISLRRINEMVPHFFLSMLFGIVAIGGKSALLDNTTVLEKGLMAGKSIMFYLLKFVMPIRLSVMYPYNDPITLASADFFIPFIACVTIACLVALSFRRTREVAFGFVFFLLILIPTFFTISKGGDLFFASDRYAYLAFVGLFLLVGRLLEHVADSRYRQSCFIAFICVLAVFSFLSFERSKVWADSETFNVDVISKYPRTYRALNNLGYWYEHHGREEEAVKKYLEALDVFPRYPDALVNLSILYAKQHGYGPDVIRKFEEVVALVPMEKNAHHNLGVAYQKTGRIDDAITQYLMALEIDPLHSESRHALAEAYGKKEMFREAVEQYRIIVETDPSYARSANISIPGEE